MTERVLVCGCPRHVEGHPVHRLRLPMRADHLGHWLKTYRCDHVTRPATPSKPAERCDMAIMVLGVEDGAAPATDWANWIPSADSVNALPFRLRQYIQELHTMGDASVVHELAALRELHAALALRLATCTCGCAPGPVAYIPLGLLDHVRGPEASAQLQHLADLGWRTPDWMAVRVENDG